MRRERNKTGIVAGLAWSFGERICAQLISTIVTIILARLLEPEYYGTVAIVTVIINFLNVFVTGGFSNAIVQKKEADSLDYDTCFVLSFLVAIILYGLLVATSPFIAQFYEMPALRMLIVVLGLRLPIASLNSIQQAVIQRSMQFKNFFVATIWGTLISAVVGILLAYKGFGVWALVAQYMSNVVIDTIVLLVMNDWKPRFRFSKERISRIWKFGSKVLGSNFVDAIIQNVRSLLIGKVFGAEDLSFYNQGQKYTSLIVDNVNSSISKVMLPVYSQKQSDKDELIRSMRLSVSVATYILVPLLIGFGALSDTFVRVILTEKWMQCVPFIRIFCLAYWFRPFCVICAQGILSIGKSGVMLRQTIIVHFFSIMTLIVAVFAMRSVVAIALSYLICDGISLVLHSMLAKRNVGYNYMDQIVDVAPTLFIGGIMGVVVYYVSKTFNDANIIILLVQIVIGAVVYISLSLLTNNKAFAYLLSKIKRLGKRVH